MQGAVRAPHTVAVSTTGKIQEYASQFLVACAGENEELGALEVKGYARHIFCRNSATTLTQIRECCREVGAGQLLAGAIPLTEEGQFLLITSVEGGAPGVGKERMELLLHLLGQRKVKEPQHRSTRRGYTPPSELVPMLVSWEYVIGAASVRPVATGAGGPEGKKYHPLYARSEPTKVEQKLPFGAEADNVSGGSLHAGITGRNHVPGRKKGVDKERGEPKQENGK